MPLIIGLIVVVILAAVILVVIGLRDQSGDDPLQSRLAEFAASGENVNLEEIELSQPLSERIILPIARKFSELALRFTPQNAINETAHKLEMAGNPRGMQPATFWAMHFIIAGGFAGFLFFIFTIGSIDWSWGRKLLIVGVFFALGYYMPDMLIKSTIDRRQKSIRKAMPDALDLLTICVEAGLGFDGAMAKVHEKWDNELSLAFGRVIREIQLGKLRRDALRDMSDRIGLPEMTSFVAAVIQSEQLGVSMAKVLHIQADQMRIKRRQAAEELAHQAPIKMLVPMALLIFPSICIVLMTPAVLQLMRSTLMGVM
jgi:tight adherence protein C